MSKLMVLALLLVLSYCHDLHYLSNPNIYTLVTGLFDSKSQNLDTQLTNLRSMAASPLNLIVVVQENLMSKVPADIANNKTHLLSANPMALGDNWQQINSNIISNSTQKIGEGNALDYTRMLWLNFAQKGDTFDTDELIWVDLDYFTNVEQFLTKENIDRFVTDYKHHFFIETLTQEPSIHTYPGAESTYFNTNLTSFVGKQLFGGRKESIQTISIIYEDIMRVALYLDRKIWSEEALYGQLAHRAPFLISYLTITSGSENRLLTDSSEPTPEQLSAIENSPIRHYTKLSYLVKSIILLLVLLILLEVLNLARLMVKKRKMIDQQPYNTVSEIDSPRHSKSDQSIS